MLRISPAEIAEMDLWTYGAAVHQHGLKYPPPGGAPKDDGAPEPASADWERLRASLRDAGHLEE